MSDVVINALIVAGSTIILAVLSKLFGKRDTSYDQIQQDLAGQRNDARNTANELAWVKQVVALQEDENDELRQLLQSAGIATPPRKPRPARPVPIVLEVPSR